MNQNICFCESKGQSTLVVTFDPNLMEHNYYTKYFYEFTSSANCHKVNCTQSYDKPKFSEKSTVWLAPTLKPYNMYNAETDCG